MNDSSTSVKLTSKNQLTIPAAVVRKLRLKPGDRLAYEVVNGSVILKPLPDLRQQLAKVHALSAGLNKGFATDKEIKQTIRDYYRSKPLD